MPRMLTCGHYAITWLQRECGMDRPFRPLPHQMDRQGPVLRAKSPYCCVKIRRTGAWQACGVKIGRLDAGTGASL